MWVTGNEGETDFIRTGHSPADMIIRTSCNSSLDDLGALMFYLCRDLANSVSADEQYTSIGAANQY
jgi:hypothetical protein